MRLNEIYFAHQGEGPRMGVPSIFVRLHHCPVGCAWCDTPFTWDKTEPGIPRTPQEIAAQALRLASETNAQQIVITGGEPLVHADLSALLAGLPGSTVEIETSGILPPRQHEGDVLWNLSPKMPSARPKIGPNPAILSQWLPYAASWKLVVEDEIDFQAACDLVSCIGAPADQVYLMPQARTREELRERQTWLLERAKGTPFRVTTRMHVAAYGNERGR